MDLHPYIRDIPDFPKKGIVFKDITPLLKSPEAFAHVINVLAQRYGERDFNRIVGIESRGFIFGAALAVRLGKSFVPIRKPGKLPAETVSQSFELEYGTDRIEIHKDAIDKSDRVLIVDDLLATGGTLEAAAKLVEDLGGTVEEIATVIELTFLNGRERLGRHAVYALLQY